MDHCTHGPLHTWTTAHMDHCTHGPLHTWTTAHMDHCTLAYRIIAAKTYFKVILFNLRCLDPLQLISYALEIGLSIMQFHRAVPSCSSIVQYHRAVPSCSSIVQFHRAVPMTVSIMHTFQWHYVEKIILLC